MAIRILAVLPLILALAGCSTGAVGTPSPSPLATTTALLAPTDTPAIVTGVPLTRPVVATAWAAPASAAWPTPTPPIGCSQAEIADLLTDFTAAHSRGDIAALRSVFPSEGSPPGGPDGVLIHLQQFGVSDVDPQTGIQHFSTYRLEELWPYLTARHAQREWLHLTGMTLNSTTPDGLANIEFSLAREAEDRPPHAMVGKGAINCKERTIIAWSMGPGAAPVLVTRPPTTPATPVRTASARAGSPIAPASSAPCPVTVPNQNTPPGEAPSPQHHGNGELWIGIGIEANGMIQFRPDEIEPDGSFGRKVFWWRGIRGYLTIEGRRLDAPAPPLRARIPDGYGPIGFQSSAVYFPTDGCWEITGRVAGIDGEVSLTFIVLAVQPAP